MDVSDNISPGIAWPPRQTTICPLGPVGGVADRVGDPPLPPRVRALHRARPADGRRRAPAREGRRSRCLTPPTEPRRRPRCPDHGRRPAPRGHARPARHRRLRGRRRLRAPLLLPPAHEPGRHVPAVPRRGRRAPRSGARRVVHDAGGRRTGRPHRDADGRRRRRRACSSSCSPTTRSTARCATRAASARCRTRR